MKTVAGEKQIESIWEKAREVYRRLLILITIYGNVESRTKRKFSLAQHRLSKDVKKRVYIAKSE
jgi:hypothetical protein